MTEITVEQYIESFPHSTFPKQEGEPTYEKIQAIHKLAAANAASVETTRGGGQHGYLAIVLEPATYTTLTGATFMPPTNPGPVPIIAGNTRTAQVAAQENAHKEHLREYKEYVKVSKAVLQLTTKAFEEKYLKHLCHRLTGYNNVTVRQVFRHLYNTYGNISELDLVENEEKMKKAWNQEEPIEVLFNQIEEAVEYAQHGNAPFTNAQVLNIAFVLMAQAKIFKDACKEWRRKPPNDKTWPNFKNHFFAAYIEWKDDNKYTTSEYTDSNLANYARDTAEALQTMLQVNNATVEEQAQQMANLTIQNQDLRDQLQALTSQLSSMQSTLQQLTSNSDNSNNNSQRNQRGNNNRTQNQRSNDDQRSNRTNNKRRIPLAYCHTHGGTYARNHNSQTCRAPGPNHVREATFEDRRGGSENNL